MAERLEDDFETIRTLTAARTALERLGNLEDTILLQGWSENLFRDFVVAVDLVRDASGEILPHLGAALEEHEYAVLLRFVGVHHLAFQHRNSETLLASEPNWSLNEVEGLEVTQDDEGRLCFTFHWASDRRSLSVACLALEIRPARSGQFAQLSYPTLDASERKGR